VLLEEVDELWDEVKKSPHKRDEQAMQAEAVQVAAMALRFLVDVCKVGQHPVGCVCFECEDAQMQRDVASQLGIDATDAEQVLSIDGRGGKKASI
jgi:hypothetical protein